MVRAPSLEGPELRRWIPVVVVVLVLSLLALPGSAADTVVGTDGYARTVTGGWGTADAGGAWSQVGGAAALTVSGGWGLIKVPAAGATRGALQSGLSVLD